MRSVVIFASIVRFDLWFDCSLGIPMTESTFRFTLQKAYYVASGLPASGMADTASTISMISVD